MLPAVIVGLTLELGLHASGLPQIARIRQLNMDVELSARRLGAETEQWLTKLSEQAKTDLPKVEAYRKLAEARFGPEHQVTREFKQWEAGLRRQIEEYERGIPFKMYRP